MDVIYVVCSCFLNIFLMANADCSLLRVFAVHSIIMI